MLTTLDACAGTKLLLNDTFITDSVILYIKYTRGANYIPANVYTLIDRDQQDMRLPEKEVKISIP